MVDLRNIIFDFGGVVHDICYGNVGRAFASNGVGGMENFYSRDFQTSEMDDFEKGLISPSQFRDYLRTLTSSNLSDSQIDNIVNAILIDVPQERVSLLLELRKHYRTFLFSNTNQINYDCFSSRLVRKYGFDIFEDCFDAAYFSHQIHMRKPSTEGFRLILNEQQLLPAETLFIDDIESNLVGARELGIRTYCLAQGSILDLFDNDGNPTQRLLQGIDG